ncbi:MAG: hypothetical protein BAW33_02770 [Desulfobacterales bacterium C00003104]|nr:MAG: hypothetical protein BAW33_02755 [Desulfobacterales bacterium C00003104]OEU60228.1 MAG: hypothetical protein BAW33_02770 [Desulfobacterales bacterium C00003104]
MNVPLIISLLTILQIPKGFVIIINKRIFPSFETLNLYLGRLQIAFFSVNNEHQEQGAKVRNSGLLQA